MDRPAFAWRLRHRFKARASTEKVSAGILAIVYSAVAFGWPPARKESGRGTEEDQARPGRWLKFKCSAAVLSAAHSQLTISLGGQSLNPSPKHLHIPVEHTTLANGLRVVASPDRSAPFVTVGVYYQIGFRLEPQGRSGFAHLFEHMMFQGSENAGKMEHIRLINSSGGLLNGTTHYDITNYFEAVPSNALERVLWLEADRMRALKVDDENLRNQRDVVKEEVRSEKDT